MDIFDQICKWWKIAIIPILISFFIWFYLDGNKRENQANEKFRDQDYSGVVREIEVIKDRRGYIQIKMNDQKIYLGIRGEKIQHLLRVNDSLVKKQGSEDFKIYRKNGYGKWQEMLFK